MEPCYTVFHPESGTFSNIWTEYAEDYQVFLENYRRDAREYGRVEAFMAKARAAGEQLHRVHAAMGLV